MLVHVTKNTPLNKDFWGTKIPPITRIFGGPKTTLFKDFVKKKTFQRFCKKTNPFQRFYFPENYPILE
jgi:hypothetical protein